MLSLVCLLLASGWATWIAVRRFGWLSMPALLMISAVIFVVLDPTLNMIELAFGVDRPWVNPGILQASRSQVLHSAYANNARFAAASGFGLSGMALLMFRRRHVRWSTASWRGETPPYLTIVMIGLLLLGILGLSYRALDYGGLGGLLKRHWTERRATGDLALYMGLLENLLVTAFICFFVVARRFRRGGEYLRLGIGLVVCFAMMILHGSRIAGFSVFIAGMFVARLYGERREGRLFALFSVGVVIVLMGWLFIRGSSHSLDYEAGGQALEANYEESGVVGLLERGLELNSYEFYLAAARDVPRRFPYLGAGPYVRLATFWIPRSVWPDRPISTNSIVAARYYPDREGLSLNANLAGEAQMSLGFAGQVVMFPMVTIWICFLWIGLLAFERPAQPILLVLGLIYAFVLFRSAMMNPTLNIGVQGLAVVGLEKIVRLLRLRTGSKNSSPMLPYRQRPAR